MSHILITIPIRTVSEANCTHHWRSKAKRHSLQKYITKMAFKEYAKSIPMPCTIKLTRIAPGSLDEHDNLRMSLKWVVDAICDCIVPGLRPGRADDTDGIKIEYAQEKGQIYGVRVDVSY